MTCGTQDRIEQIPTEAKAVQEKKVETNEASVERLKHPLENTWSMWLYREYSKDWGQNLVELTSFDTVEDFWCLYHHILLPSELGEGQYSVFKKGMKPEWEHAANKRGGRWLITLERKNLQEANRIWIDMVLLMIGENFGDSNSAVCGAVVNAKAKNNKAKLAIWVSNKKYDKEIKEIGMKLKQTLDLPCKITFHAHNSNQTIYNL